MNDRRRRHLTGGRAGKTSWVDSFVVFVDGPAERAVPGTLPDPTRVRVGWSRRIVPTLDPSYGFISDDENFDHPVWGPSVSVTAGALQGQASLQSQPTGIWSFSVTPVDNRLVFPDDPEFLTWELPTLSGSDPFVDQINSMNDALEDRLNQVPQSGPGVPLEVQRPLFEVASAPPDGSQLADPETVTLGSSEVYVFYTRVLLDPAYGDQLWRASVPT